MSDLDRSDGDARDGRQGDGDGGQQDHGRRNQSGQGQQGQSTVERAVSVASVAVTLALLGFVAWQAWTVPAAENPEARVVDTATLPNGGVEVTVEFVNDQDVGVVSATVELSCGSPPAEVTFEHVPAGGRATAHVVCPPGSSDPAATVRTWQEP